MLTNGNFSKIPVLSAVLAISSTLGFGLVYDVPDAKALSIIPQTEGEVKLINISCLSESVPCLDPTDKATTKLSFGYTVESLDYNSDGKGQQFGQSRLFVDKQQSANDWGFGITFFDKDEGTNAAKNEYWFRPVAYVGDKPYENGRLEVGRFKFSFDNPVSKVKLDFLDVEVANTSGVLEVNGKSVKDYLPAGPNNSVQSLFLDNVTSLVLQLGNPGSKFASTGDGALLSDFSVVVENKPIKSVPEPGVTAGLGILAVSGVMSLLRRKRESVQS